MTTTEESTAAAPGTATGRWELTGNHSVSIPLIERATGALARIGVLHRGALGIVEWAGTGDGALLAPALRVDGSPLALPALEWERLDTWIPRFTADAEGKLRLRGTICAPAGHEPGLRGAVYMLEVENRGRAEREVEVALEGSWSRSLRRVTSERPWGERNRVALSAAGVVLEAAALGPALALVSGGSGELLAHEVATEDGAVAEGASVAVANGSPIRLRLGRRLKIGAGKRGLVAFYLGVAPEGDGALATALQLRRTGATELLRAGRLELARLARTPERTEWAERLNRALFFNYFYATGRAVDDDRFYPVSSRSPQLADGPTFRERDALLWSLPALTLLDPWLGRELLLRAFEQYSHRAGEHVRYLDGSVLTSGFGLDQACAYGVALERYARDAHDEHIGDDPLVQDVLRDLDDLLFHRLHPEVFLGATELLPSGDLADHPFVTYDNALLHAFCRALARFWVADNDADRALLAGGAEEIEAAVWHDCTADVQSMRLLAWSVDLQGEAAVYDDPAGSLGLLPFLGFCDPDDPIWQATMEFLGSRQYPFWLGGRAFPGLASRRHPNAASLAALCGALLGPGKADALKLLARLPLDDAIACEAWDPDSGQPVLGTHHAALAGFMGWALWQALEGAGAQTGQEAGAPPGSKRRKKPGGKGG